MLDIFDSVCQHGDWTASVAPNFRKASTKLNPSSEAQGHRKTVKWGSHRTNSFASGRKVKRTGRRKINLINANTTYRISFVCDNFVHVYDTTQSHSSLLLLLLHFLLQVPIPLSCLSFCCVTHGSDQCHLQWYGCRAIHWNMGNSPRLHHETMNSSPQATCDCH